MNKLELPFDLYTRNFLITKLVKAIKDKDKLKILDVGGRGGQLKDFLKEDEYYILDILNSEEKEENYIVGDIRDAPLRNSSFDIVISSDLYEHIPPRDRLRVISEMLRLSKNFVVLGAPFYSKEVEEAERRVYDFFLKVTGKPHPWLKEHIENGLPSKDELEAFLTKKGYEFCCRETNNISNWFLLQSFIFYAYAYGIPSEKVNKVYRYYNENFVELGDFLKPTYRKIYLIGEKGKLPSLRHKLKINKSINLLKYQNLFSLIFDCIGEDTIRKDTHIRNLESTLSSIKDSIVRKDNQIKNLNRIVNDLNNHIQLKDTHIRNLESTLSSIKSSIAWRLLTRYRRLKEKILPLGTRRRHVYDLGLFSLRIIINEGWRSFWLKFKRALSKKVLFFKVKEPYKIWILKNEPKKEKLEEYKKESFSFKYRPKISIIIPVWNTDKKWLRKCMESVLNQVYDNWELCIADGGSTKPYVKGILKRYAKKDSRIKVKFLKENKGIAGNSNEALSLATGEFIGFLDHDDELAPFALYEVVKLLNEKPHLDFIYSDEDKIDEKGKRKDPFFKPDWSPDMFLSQNYLCHLSIIRKELVGKVGGFREGYDGSQDYDLFLRVTELIDEKKIAHIPKILYHWRSVLGSAAKMVSAKPYAFMAARKALKDALSRREIEAEILDGLLLSSYRVRYKIVEDPKVSIIIPTKDKVSTLKTCIDSILEKTNYKNYEIFIIDNQSKEEKTLKYYHRIKNNSKIKIVKYNKPFNFSEINNFAVSKVDTEYILFLNNDT
ncbi:MAG: glycosyltransferase, partial [Deltaproteobacteria bacterium]|nr:glycosyltransferase [Deltaproteobacteria bacterium]